MSKSLRSRAVVLGAAALLALAGCSAQTDPAGTEAPGGEAAESQGAWPRTVEVGESEVTLDAEPQHIVALSTEVGDLGLELVGPDRFAAVSEGSVLEGTGNQIELAEQVETVLTVHVSPEPEQILALEPDLVLLNAHREDQSSTADALTEAGIPVATFGPSDFANPDAVAQSIETLGELLGAEEAAAEAATGLQEDVAEVTALTEGVTERPSVAVLFARGGSLMLQGVHSATSELVVLGGGDLVAEEQGWQQAVPADPETILAADPDVILVQNHRGAGLEPFADILENPALAEATAIAGDEVHLVEAATTSGTSGTSLGTGLREIAELLHPELF